jgi:hypothetical protein
MKTNAEMYKKENFTLACRNDTAMANRVRYWGSSGDPDNSFTMRYCAGSQRDTLSGETLGLMSWAKGGDADHWAPSTWVTLGRCEAEKTFSQYTQACAVFTVDTSLQVSQIHRQELIVSCIVKLCGDLLKSTPAVCGIGRAHSCCCVFLWKTPALRVRSMCRTHEAQVPALRCANSQAQEIPRHTSP